MTTFYWFHNLIQVHWDESGLGSITTAIDLRNKIYDNLTPDQIDWVVATHLFFN